MLGSHILLFVFICTLSDLEEMATAAAKAPALPAETHNTLEGSSQQPDPAGQSYTGPPASSPAEASQAPSGEEAGTSYESTVQEKTLSKEDTPDINRGDKELHLSTSTGDEHESSSREVHKQTLGSQMCSVHGRPVSCGLIVNFIQTSSLCWCYHDIIRAFTWSWYCIRRGHLTAIPWLLC